MPKNWISSNKNEQNHFLVNKNFESNVIERHYEKRERLKTMKTIKTRDKEEINNFD